jgi:AraC-like DNA-binding protein
MPENDEHKNNFRIAVPTDYKEIFSHFYFSNNRSSETVFKTLSPTFQTILVFNFGAKSTLYTKHNTEIDIDKCLVLGPIKQAFDYSLSPNAEILVASFKDDAFYRFFGNASVAEHLPMNPDELLNENCFTALWAELIKINDINNRVTYFLDFCKPYLRHRNLIAEKLSVFKEDNLDAIKSIAGELNQTERNIQLNYKKYFGYTAKEINRYQRFLKAIELLQNIASTSTKIDWFAVINECGYYDQSQLIHDFKHYINLSPTKYLRFQQEICIAKAE